MSFSTARCTISILCSMVGETVHDLPSTNPQADDDTRNDSEAESTTTTTSSSLTPAAAKMADEKISEMSEFFKTTTVTEGERAAYHDFGWLSGNLTSTIPEVEIPTVHDSTVICFESHLIIGLGHPPSKFLATTMSNLGCRLVHFNPNAIAALSCFTMLCEYWLGIAPNTSLFWYCYSPVRYSKVVYSRIGLSLRRPAGRNTSRLSSRDVGRDPRRGGSSSICMSQHRG
jgi:hypothetical protein